MPFVDLNGPDEQGVKAVVEYVEDNGPVLVAPNLTVTHADSPTLVSATVIIFDCEGDEICQEDESLAAFEGRGLMTCAVVAPCNHAFNELGVHRIELRAAAHNVKSQAVARRLGFRRPADRDRPD